MNSYQNMTVNNISFNTSVDNSLNNSDYFTTVSLEYLNSEEAIRRSPVVIFISILMVIGVFGNVNVIYIYARKFSPSTYRLFVLTLATIDIVSCCISMPFEIADELNPYMFDFEIACKIFRFLNTCLAIASALMLVVIASERYRKICKPYGNQMSEKHSKYALLAVVCFTVVSTLPALYVYGNKTVIIPEYSYLNGTECTWADYAEGSVVGYVYFGWGILVIITCMILLVVLYSLVGNHLRTHTIKVQSTIRIKRRRKSRRRSLNSWRKSRKAQPKDGKALDGTQSNELGGSRSKSEVLNDRKSVENGLSNLSVARLKSNSLPNSNTERYTKIAFLNKTNTDNIPVKINIIDENNVKTSPTSEEKSKSRFISQSSSNSDSTNGQTTDIENRSSRNSIFTVSDSYSRDSENDTAHEYISDSESKASMNIIDPNVVPEVKTMPRKVGTIMRKTKTFLSEREQRITKVLFTITLLFISTFLPYIIILIVYSADVTYEDKLSPIAYIIYLIALRLYLINNVANSMLYISFDLKFRKHFVNIYQNLIK